MEHENTEKCIKEYEEKRPEYEDFTNKLSSLMEELLLEKKTIDVLPIESRTKSLESFAEKIERRGKEYTDPIKEITDYSGVRVIAYYPDDIKKIGEIIDQEFKIVKAKSIFGEQASDPEYFGYNSDKYVISLYAKRKRMTEWKKFSDHKAEIQVRTVLQHAWSFVSHQLDYKKLEEAPIQFRRRLNRLVGLFEIADDQFEVLRNERQKYLRKLSEESKKEGHFDVSQPRNLETLQAILDFYFPDYLRGRSMTQQLSRDITPVNLTMEDLNISFAIIKDYDFEGSPLLINNLELSQFFVAFVALCSSNNKFYKHHIDKVTNVLFTDAISYFREQHPEWNV